MNVLKWHLPAERGILQVEYPRSIEVEPHYAGNLREAIIFFDANKNETPHEQYQGLQKTALGSKLMLHVTSLLQNRMDTQYIRSISEYRTIFRISIPLSAGRECSFEFSHVFNNPFLTHRICPLISDVAHC